MALKATIYKAELNIADVDRHFYTDLNLTIARHPSETDERMMARVLAMALYAEQNPVFTKGLFDVDEPELWARDLTDAITLWIDLGQPDETRLKKACARAARVVALCYGGGCERWWTSIADKLARLDNLEVRQLSAASSAALGALAQRGMKLQVMIQDGDITVHGETGEAKIELATLKAGRA